MLSLHSQAAPRDLQLQPVRLRLSECNLLVHAQCSARLNLRGKVVSAHWDWRDATGASDLLVWQSEGNDAVFRAIIGPEEFAIESQ
jgi:hypothetical protein